ncbi:YicC/YloC family endoribonuclease [Desulfolithobacter sp.]
MRPRSMTGFGRGEITADDRTWIAEVRTVNHRYLDQRVQLPRPFTGLEERVKKLVARHQDRGRVEVSLQIRGEALSETILNVNMDLARQYYDCLTRLGEAFELGNGRTPVGLGHMLTLRDLITQEEQNPDLDREWPLVSKALSRALAECDQMRSVEGQALRKELLGRLERFARILEIIEGKIPEILIQRQNELRQRIEKLLGSMDVDPMRLAQETAILADKCDVTEETVRLHSHIDQFRHFLDIDEPVGRRLDFLLQEFLREVNTLGSKISNSAIAHFCVEMKNEIEKLREQIQNIE